MANKLPEGGGASTSKWQNKPAETAEKSKKTVKSADIVAATAGIKGAASSKVHQASKLKPSHRPSPGPAEAQKQGMVDGVKDKPKATFNDYIPRKPEKPHPITPQAKAAWLSKIDDPELKTRAAVAVEQIEYVTFDAFMEGLRDATQQLMDKVGDDRFVVLFDPAVDDKGNPKSGMWVTKLAYNQMERKPERVEEWSTFDNPHLRVEEGSKGVGHLVIFDDASYSGTQMQRVLVDLFVDRHNLKKHFPNAEVHLVIPFVSQEAIEKIERQMGELHPLAAELVHVEKPMAPSPFPPELGLEGSTATYFQHKVAAGGHSVVDLVGEKLVDAFDPPYKKGSG